MKVEIHCSVCAALLVVIEKEEVLQEDIDLYVEMTTCSIDHSGGS